MVEFSDIENAYNRINDKINNTPVFTSDTLNKMVNASAFIKCENFQKVGAFKFRGACNKISQLTPLQKQKGIITHSSGNHAQAVALASSLYGIKSIIVMPENAPQVKVDATKGYGAEIFRCKSTLEDRTLTTEKLIESNGYTLIHPYDDDDIIAGAGTAAYELIKEVGDLDFLFVPVGGGGLISGSSIAAKGLCPEIQVIGVEPEKADDAYRSVKTGNLMPVVNSSTVADGLKTALSARTFSVIQKFVDEIILVSEKEIIDSMKFLWERMKIIAEPSGAVSIAGLLKIREKIKNQKVGAIVSGGNIDLNDFFDTFYNKI
jgi:threonine dehydratase